MSRSRAGLLVCAAIAVLLAIAACGGGPSSEDQANAEEWAWLTEAQQNLDAKRQELADLRAAAQEATISAEESAEEGEAGSEEAAEGDVEEIDDAAQIVALESEIDTLSDEFTSRLVGFLNADPMIEGEEPTDRQRAALRMKSSEDIVLADEWIQKGGDYKRALDILNTAIMFDPDNPDLKAAIERAETERYMSAERFALAEKGMTEDQVRAVLGQANLLNVREYPDKDVVAWFYPTAEDGSAAAVWFQPEKDSGQLRVYQVKFDAINPEEMGEDQ